MKNETRLESVVELQRELIASTNPTITGRVCLGILTNQTDAHNHRVLVKDLQVTSFSIRKRVVENTPEMFIKKTAIGLHHSWVDQNLILDEGDNNLAHFQGDIDEYTRHDGTTSYGFVPLHPLAMLSLNIALTIYATDKYSLEKAFKFVEHHVIKLGDAIKQYKSLCNVYMNADLLAMLIYKYHSLKEKIDRKNGSVKPKPKRKRKKKNWTTL